MSNKGELPLYFVAIVPPEPLRSEAMQWKEYFAKEYNSKAALRSPPHITLHMPFRLKPDKEAALISTLQNVKIEPFKIALKDYGSFSPKVIYINVVASVAITALYENVQFALKTKMNLHNADYKGKGFHPHITIAFRDLKKSFYQAAWGELKEKNYENSFQCSSFTLLKHNGRTWDEYREFDL